MKSVKKYKSGRRTFPTLRKFAAKWEYLSSLVKGGIKSYSKYFWLIPTVVILSVALWKVPQWQMRSFRSKFTEAEINKLDIEKRIQIEKEWAATENNARTTLAQIIGGLVILAGLFFTWRNVRIAEEGKLTERFSKAIELLGNDKFDIRLGGIYALERIARDSQRDHWTVIEVLIAYVRERAPLKYELRQAVSPSDEDLLGNPVIPVVVDLPISSDIQAVIDVIGRRKWTSQEATFQRLDLSRVYLRGTRLMGAVLNKANIMRSDLREADMRNAILCEANLCGVNFTDADLRGADLRKAKLSGAIFKNARMDNADLRGADLGETYEYEETFDPADLTGAILNGANLSDTNLWGVDMSGATLMKTKLCRANLGFTKFTGAFLDRVDFSEAKHLSWEQISALALSESTLLPPDLEERRIREQENQAHESNQGRPAN